MILSYNLEISPVFGGLIRSGFNSIAIFYDSYLLSVLGSKVTFLNMITSPLNLNTLANFYDLSIYGSTEALSIFCLIH